MSTAAIVAGIGLIAAALLVDVVGAGTSPGLGPSQQLALVIGLAITGLGHAGIRAIVARLLLTRIGLLAVALVASLALAEAGLRVDAEVATRWPRSSDGHPSADELVLLDDPQLGVRFAPHAVQHDARGLRNDVALQRADVVTIGDSQTWGHNVGRAQAWPQRLASRAGVSVYNMGMPHYGPVQYGALIEAALELKPRVVVVGLYLGNDLWNAVDLTYELDAWLALRDRDFDVSVCNALARELQSVVEDEREFVRSFRPPAGSWSSWLTEHSVIVSRLRDSGRWPGGTRSFERARAYAAWRPASATAIERPFRTVIKTRGFALTQDVDSPCIAEGYRLTVDRLAAMKRACDGAAATLVVVVIPTKAATLAPLLTTSLRAGHARLVEVDEVLRRRLLQDLHDSETLALDLTKALRVAVTEGQEIYPDDTDDHFEAAGYDWVARAVAELLSDQGLLTTEAGAPTR